MPSISSEILATNRQIGWPRFGTTIAPCSVANLRERIHQRIHAGHNCWVLPEEEQFLTPGVLQAANMIGTQDQLIERLHGLASAGLNQVMVLPNFDTRTQVLDRISKDIIPHVRDF